MEAKACETYVFPNTSRVVLEEEVSNSRSPTPPPSSQPPPLQSALRRRGHARSASTSVVQGINHAMINNPTNWGHEVTPARKHSRTMSQGQLPEKPTNPSATTTTTTSARGHSRTGSKTDFILPPGHVERPDRTKARPMSQGGDGQARKQGHSRQASRTESIYTLRKHTVSMLDRMRFWRRKVEDLGPRCRTVVPNTVVPPDTPWDQHPNCAYAGNEVRTTKYTVLSFLPKNLFEQFHRYANLYFVLICLLNWVPAINAFGKEIAMLPVLFVLGVTAIKDLFEDRRRYTSDKRVNNSTCRVYHRSQNRYHKCKWKDVRVGDIVHLSNNELIPADILVLRSSDKDGLAYIETCNLDGETSLKQRLVVRGMVEQQEEFHPTKFESRLECDAPTTKIYHFTGSLIHNSGERVPLTTDNLLLRDCVLKNTDFVEGLVVYAGRETKAMLNNGGSRYKRSRLERHMNTDVMWCVLMLLVLCLAGSAGSGFWIASFQDPITVPFISFPDLAQYQAFYNAILAFFTFIIILQVMIPLSLYVTIEIIKLGQVYHITCDDELYDPASDKRIECRALNIPEDLGQIQYIFSDKTGTLTENKMIFRRCIIGKVDYNHQVTKDTGENNNNSQKFEAEFIINKRLQQEVIELETKFQQDRSSDISGSHQQKIQDFFLLLAICNTVIVSKHPHQDRMNASGLYINNSTNNSIQERSESLEPKESPVLQSEPETYVRLIESRPETPNHSLYSQCDSVAVNILDAGTLTPTDIVVTPAPERPNTLPIQARKRSTQDSPPSPGDLLKPIYEAESPDELALVDAAFRYNCRLVRRKPNNVTVIIPGEGVVEYEILHVLPFDSNRKRMSVIIRNPKTKALTLLCKGADSAIIPSLASPHDVESQESIFRTQQQLNSYAHKGLRVLVMAKKDLSEREYEDWLERHKLAELSMLDRERKLFDSYCIMENKLQLIGATGIEDQLQEGVPEVISALRQAGCIVWVLTGDKQETAVNIAFSCHLFSLNMELISINARSKHAASDTIHGYLQQIDREKLEREETAASSLFAGYGLKKRGLVIDGKTLTYILAPNSDLQVPFLQLCQNCSAVLCCRATPLQKAYIVRIVKEQLHVPTLAIGDGANDVSMIQTADVGIGISGREGVQAVMASDFALARFKFLKRLMFVHGHWCYDRLARMVLYFFYKNAAFVFTLFWYELYCGFSGSVMIDQMYLMLFNLMFTSIPPIVMGIYDRDCEDKILMMEPRLYSLGRESQIYQPNNFWLNMADALYQSLIIFFVALYAYYGSDVGIWEFGTTVMTSAIFVMLFHLAIETRSWTWIHFAGVVVSILLWYVFGFIYNSICYGCYGMSNPYWVFHHAIADLRHWLILFLTCVLALLPRLTFTAVRTTVFPDDVTRSALVQQRTGRAHSFLVSWSRETSSSSVIRATEMQNKSGSKAGMARVD